MALVVPTSPRSKPPTRHYQTQQNVRGMTVLPLVLVGRIHRPHPPSIEPHLPTLIMSGTSMMMIIPIVELDLDSLISLSRLSLEDPASATDLDPDHHLRMKN